MVLMALIIFTGWASLATCTSTMVSQYLCSNIFNHYFCEYGVNVIINPLVPKNRLALDRVKSSGVRQIKIYKSLLGIRGLKEIVFLI